MMKKIFALLLIVLTICIIIQIPKFDYNYLSYIMIVPGAFIGFIIAIIIHELGHLIFGLLTGYKFTSFKVLCIKIYKKDKLRIKFEPGLFSIPGQCLMKPTNRNYFMYNLGGLIFTYVLSLFSLIIFYVNNNHYLAQLIFGLFVVNTSLGVLNSIYNKDGINDICNIIRCKKNKDFLEGVLYQLDIYSNLSEKEKFKSNYNPSDDVGNIFSNVAIYRFKYFKYYNEKNKDKMEYYYKLLKKSYKSIYLPILKYTILLLILNHEFVFKNDIVLLKRSVKLSSKDLLAFKKIKLEYEMYLFFVENIINKNELTTDILEDIIINKPSDILEKLHNDMYYKLNRVYNAYKKQGFEFN